MAKGNNGKFLKKKPKTATSGNLPRGLPTKKGTRTANDTVYHDDDNDRVNKQVTYTDDAPNFVPNYDKK